MKTLFLALAFVATSVSAVTAEPSAPIVSLVPFESNVLVDGLAFPDPHLPRGTQIVTEGIPGHPVTHGGHAAAHDPLDRAA